MTMAWMVYTTTLNEVNTTCVAVTSFVAVQLLTFENVALILRAISIRRKTWDKVKNTLEALKL